MEWLVRWRGNSQNCQMWKLAKFFIRQLYSSCRIVSTWHQMALSVHSKRQKVSSLKSTPSQKQHFERLFKIFFNFAPIFFFFSLKIGFKKLNFCLKKIFVKCTIFHNQFISQFLCKSPWYKKKYSQQTWKPHKF